MATSTTDGLSIVDKSASGDCVSGKDGKEVVGAAAKSAQVTVPYPKAGNKTPLPKGTAVPKPIVSKLTAKAPPGKVGGHTPVVSATTQTFSSIESTHPAAAATVLTQEGSPLPTDCPISPAGEVATEEITKSFPKGAGGKIAANHKSARKRAARATALAAEGAPGPHKQAVTKGTAAPARSPSSGVSALAGTPSGPVSPFPARPQTTQERLREKRQGVKVTRHDLDEVIEVYTTLARRYYRGTMASYHSRGPLGSAVTDLAGLTAFLHEQEERVQNYRKMLALRWQLDQQDNTFEPYLKEASAVLAHFTASHACLVDATLELGAKGKNRSKTTRTTPSGPQPIPVPVYASDDTPDRLIESARFTSEYFLSKLNEHFYTRAGAARVLQHPTYHTIVRYCMYGSGGPPPAGAPVPLGFGSARLNIFRINGLTYMPMHAENFVQGNLAVLRKEILDASNEDEGWGNIIGQYLTTAAQADFVAVHTMLYCLQRLALRSVLYRILLRKVLAGERFDGRLLLHVLNHVNSSINTNALKLENLQLSLDSFLADFVGREAMSLTRPADDASEVELYVHYNRAVLIKHLPWRNELFIAAHLQTDYFGPPNYDVEPFFYLTLADMQPDILALARRDLGPETTEELAAHNRFEYLTLSCMFVTLNSNVPGNIDELLTLALRNEEALAQLGDETDSTSVDGNTGHQTRAIIRAARERVLAWVLTHSPAMKLRFLYNTLYEYDLSDFVRIATALDSSVSVQASLSTTALIQPQRPAGPEPGFAMPPDNIDPTRAYVPSKRSVSSINTIASEVLVTGDIIPVVDGTVEDVTE